MKRTELKRKTALRNIRSVEIPREAFDGLSPEEMAVWAIPRKSIVVIADTPPPSLVKAVRGAMGRSSRPKMTPLRKSAHAEGCTMNVAGVCNYDPATVILAHFRWLGDCGEAFKPTDLQAGYACSECNRWTDSPTPVETAEREKYEADRNFYALRAMVRTQIRMVAKGLIIVRGMPA